MYSPQPDATPSEKTKVSADHLHKETPLPLPGAPSRTVQTLTEGKERDITPPRTPSHSLASIIPDVPCPATINPCIISEDCHFSDTPGEHDSCKSSNSTTATIAKMSNGNTSTSQWTQPSSNTTTSEHLVFTADSLQPEPYELLDLEGFVEDFTHSSDAEEEMEGQTVGNKGMCTATEQEAGRSEDQPLLKQVSLARWSRGEAVKDSATDQPIEV